MVDRGRRLDDNSFMPLFGEVPKIDIRREEAVDLPPWFVPDKWYVRIHAASTNLCTSVVASSYLDSHVCLLSKKIPTGP